MIDNFIEIIFHSTSISSSFHDRQISKMLRKLNLNSSSLKRKKSQNQTKPTIKLKPSFQVVFIVLLYTQKRASNPKMM